MKIEKLASDKPYPFSDLVKANGFLFLSGQVSMSQDGRPLPGSVTAQTLRILESVEKTLERVGASLADIVRVQVFLSDIKHYEEFNAAYRTRFNDNFPARTVVACSLAFSLDVEIEVMAVAA